MKITKKTKLLIAGLTLMMGISIISSVSTPKQVAEQIIDPPGGCPTNIVNI